MYQGNEYFANEVLAYLIDTRHGKYIHVRKICWHEDKRDVVELCFSQIIDSHVQEEMKTIHVNIKSKNKDDSCLVFSALNEISHNINPEELQQ